MTKNKYVSACLRVLGMTAVAIILFIIAMTQKWFATPVINKVMQSWGPENSSVESAHLRFPQVAILRTSGIDAGKFGKIEGADVTINPFGFLPGLAWFPRVSSANGQITRPAETAENSLDINSLKRTLNRISLTEFKVNLSPNETGRELLISSAEGSLHDGKINAEASGGGAVITVGGGQETSQDNAYVGTVTISGDNVANIAALAGLAGPDTPPYDLAMGYKLEPGLISLTIEQGKVGDSDLSGTLFIDPSKDVPYVTADLKSNALDLDDLGIVFGLPFGTGAGETVGKVQQKAKLAFDTSDRLIPYAEIDFERLDSIDGNIKFTGNNVKAPMLDLSQLYFDLDIDGRVVTGNEIRFTFPQGNVTSYVTLDGTQSPAAADVKGKIENVTMKSLGASSFAKGALQGEFVFSTRGNNFRAAGASASGTVALWSYDFELAAIGSELAGLDLGEALILLLGDSGPAEFTPARCVAVTLQTEAGAGVFAPAVIDTEDSLIVLEGGLNFGTEALDFDVKTDAKDVSFGSLFGDVSVGGTFRNPSLNVVDEDVILQAGIAVVLGALAGPLAALPFIEPGDGDDAPCVQLLSRAQTAADTPAAALP